MTRSAHGPPMFFVLIFGAASLHVKSMLDHNKACQWACQTQHLPACKTLANEASPWRPLDWSACVCIWIVATALKFRRSSSGVCMYCSSEPFKDLFVCVCSHEPFDECVELTGKICLVEECCAFCEKLLSYVRNFHLFLFCFHNDLTVWIILFVVDFWWGCLCW